MLSIDYRIEKAKKQVSLPSSPSRSAVDLHEEKIHVIVEIFF